MNTQELKKLKESLLEEKKTILSTLRRIAKKNPRIDDDWQATFRKVDSSMPPDERAQSVTIWERGRAVEQRLEVRLQEINGALKKIEQGNYGKCEKCNIDINPKRLMAMPASNLCMKCAQDNNTELV